MHGPSWHNLRQLVRPRDFTILGLIFAIAAVGLTLLLYFRAGATHPFTGLLLGLLIAYFAVVISSLSRKYEHSLAAPGQKDLDNEYLVRMGALAAGAAHELSSPLTTMAVLIDELRQQPDADDRRKLAEDLRIMSDQIELCRGILCALATDARDAPANERRRRLAEEVAAPQRPAAATRQVEFRRSENA
jgi:signal transduction histidine kinase